MVHGEGTPPSPSESSKAASEKSPPPAPSSARDLLTAISASAPWKNDSSASVSASSAASAMERARRQAPARIRRWLTRNGRWHATGAPFTGLACPASHLLTLPFLWNLTLPQEKNQESRDSCHAAHLMATMVAPQASVPNASIDTAHEDMIVSVPDAYALRGCLMLSCQRSTPATSGDVRAKQKRARTAGCCPWLRQHHSVGPTIWRNRSKFSVCDGRASPIDPPLDLCAPCGPSRHMHAVHAAL